MANSREFNVLVRRLNELKTHLLPKVNALGHYTKREADKIRSYRLLSHAEFEYYFEQIAERIARDAVDKWKVTMRPSNVVTSLIGFTEASFGAFPTAINGNGTEFVTLEKRISKALANYISYLKRGNNGIKESNLLQILLPIGIMINDLDRTWLNTISSFGSDRGAVAHKSAKTLQPIDPQTETETIMHIKDGIKVLDEKIIKLK